MRFSVVLPIGYMFVLFFASALPNTDVSQNTLTHIPSTLQNLLHLPAFGLLALLWIISLQCFALSKNTVFRFAMMISVAYGAALELYQAWVPGRFPSIGDFLLNCIGILLFSFLYLKLSPYLKHFQTQKKHPNVLIKKVVR